MGKKLYVGNLPFSVTEQTLQTTFAQHGTVETATAAQKTVDHAAKGPG